MFVKSPGFEKSGYTAITAVGGAHKEMLLNFGILVLEEGREFSDKNGVERAFGLISGQAEITWAGPGGERNMETVSRGSIVKEPPSCLHVPAGTEVRIKAMKGGAEFYIFGVPNSARFDPVFYASKDVRKVQLKSGSLETTERELRIISDDDNASSSQMVFGECLNHPGKWSSYPPHHHPHPEIYHYRFEPVNGFGYAGEGDEVYLVKNGDTLLVEPHKVHPQTAAPGYGMVYIWAMPHLPEERFGGESRRFVPEHTWMLA